MFTPKTNKRAPPAIICCKQNNHIKKYKCGHQIGVGGFANVYSVKSLDSHNIYACKVINKSILRSKEQKRKLISEIKIHNALPKHENIIQFIKYFDDKNNVYILLEMCTNETLMELINKQNKLNENEVKFFIKQIINGIKFLHSQQIIHRDLKLGNLLLDNNLTIKICDFGLATRITQTNDRKTTICGTPNYIAPEILNQKKFGQGHSYEVDIWSLGVIMFTLLTGKPPFETQNIHETYRRIKKMHYKWPNNLNISYYAKDLVSKILNINPSKRPNILQIENHAFFTNKLTNFNIPKVLPIHLGFTITNKPKAMNNYNDFIFITKHCDYTKKYGIGYILSNGFTGVYFNDSTKIIYNRNKNNNNITYINEKNKIKYCSFNNFASNISKKVKLLKYFDDHLTKSQNEIYILNNGNENKILYVCKYIKEKYGVIFKLSNDMIQVNFTDCSKIIFKDSTRSIILYCDKYGSKEMFTLYGIHRSNQKDLKKRFKYAQQLLKKI